MIKKTAGVMLLTTLLTLTGGCSKDSSVTDENSKGTYTVSGKVLDESGTGIKDVYVNISGMSIKNGSDERISYSVPSNAEGEYIFSKISNGTYTITPYKTDFTFTPSSRSVTVSGLSVSVGSFIGVSKPITGPVGDGKYTIHGRITDSYGDGIGGISVGLAGVDLKMTVKTNPDGSFSFASVPNGSYTIAPGKEGYTFSPPFLTIVVRGSDVTVDTIIASAVSGSGVDTGFAGTHVYYPMSRGASWSVIRSEADFKNQYIDSYTLTYTVSGTKIFGNDRYWVVVNDRNETESYIRVTNETVYQFSEISTVNSWNKPAPVTNTGFIDPAAKTGQAKTVMTFEGPNPYTDPLPYLRLDVEPGTVYDITSYSSSAYGSGSFTLTWRGTYHGAETVTVTAGTFADCRKYEILYDAVAVGGGAAQREITTTILWLAPNVGIVKLDETKTDGYKTTYTRQEELIGYSVPDTTM